MTTRPDPAYAPGSRIRVMTLDDCAAVADIRVRGWRWAYAGLIPQPYLDAMDAGPRPSRPSPRKPRPSRNDMTAAPLTR